MSDINTGSKPMGAHSLTTTLHDVPTGSAVSWAAIFAGAAAAAILSLVLLILGTGLGFSVVSPWSMEGISAAALGFGAIVWLSFTSIAASGMGGYLAGRLRTKWMGVHTDEVYFRDTAHGFLTWAVATLLTAALLTSVVGSIIGGGVRAGAAVADGAASAVGTAAQTAASVASGGSDSNGEGNTIQYYVDSLFRGNTAENVSELPVGEVTRIFARAITTGNMPQEDERHVARLIAEHTDVSQSDAERRVSDGFESVQSTLEEMETTAREVADEARKASAYASLWLFITLLMGAFAASLLAVFGGRQRDSSTAHS